MIKAAIINLSKNKSIGKEFNDLFASHNYKVDFINSSPRGFSVLFNKYNEQNIPVIVFCGKNLPPFKRFLNNNNYSASLIAAGNYNDNLIESLLKDKHLNNFSYLAYQGFRNNPKVLEGLKERYFEDMRLGKIRDNIKLCEPLLRSSQYIFFDTRSIKYSDFPNCSESNPNGLYSEEACTIAGYMGWSEQLKGVFLYGYDIDKNMVTICNKLIAELIWHICEGISVSIQEHPYLDINNNFIRKIVSMGDHGQDLNFVYSVNTSRWWMEISTPNMETCVYVPCSDDDYEKACTGEVPLRWLFFYTKYALL